MTTRLSTNESNGLVRRGGRFVRADSVVERVRAKLQLIRGEWFLDRNAGIPWVETDTAPDPILGAKPNLAHARQYIEQAIRSVEGVATIDTLRVELGRTRSLTITFGVNGEAVTAVAT